jgi:hypothetical protein
MWVFPHYPLRRREYRCENNSERGCCDCSGDVQGGLEDYRWWMRAGQTVGRKSAEVWGTAGGECCLGS